MPLHQAGSLLRGVGAVLAGLSPQVAEAQRHEQALHRGRCLGLTDTETREVIDMWAVRAGFAYWSAIDDALVRRALGEAWRP